MSGADSGVSLFILPTIIGTSVGIVNARFSLVFLVTYGIVKMFLKIMKNETVNTEKLIYWPEVYWIKGRNGSKTLAKNIYCECTSKFNSRKCNSKQKQNNDKCHYECKKQIQHHDV